jgi:DmsE family decaheme c-type cytochrome
MLHIPRTTFAKITILQAFVFALLVGGLLVVTTAGGPAYQDQDIGICADCHEDVCTDFKLVQHAGIKIGTWREEAKDAETICANCHGDPTKHLDEGGGPGTIFSFKQTEHSSAKSAKCLNCHHSTRNLFFAGPHGKAGMDCTNCHDDLMSSTTLTASSNKICSTCHEDVVSQFQLNERHRLQEGILNCTSCHDPHGPSARERLGGFKHEACLKCHTDKGGPFLYEHDASTIEGCTSCHEVHGSPNRRMLTHHSIADLCFSCHGAAPSWHARFDAYSSNCTTCHATIHGSNLSKIFLK